jgi:predicted flap endonuclease-1-like 5' DNA nuclease
MPYTLMKGLGWFALALLIGIVMGWLLRSVAARRQVARARAHHVDGAELERLRGRVANLEPVVGERDRLRVELDELRAVPATAAVAPAASDVSPVVLATPDVAAGAAVLGRKIALDDLQVVEGIGPKIETLCHGIGIRTWHDLATTEVSLLRTMLLDAGPRFRTHDPGSWPRQAGLLAAGQWAEFKALGDSLHGSEPGG